MSIESDGVLIGLLNKMFPDFSETVSLALNQRSLCNHAKEGCMPKPLQAFCNASAGRVEYFFSTQHPMLSDAFAVLYLMEGNPNYPFPWRKNQECNCPFIRAIESKRDLMHLARYLVSQSPDYLHMDMARQYLTYYKMLTPDERVFVASYMAFYGLRMAETDRRWYVKTGCSLLWLYSNEESEEVRETILHFVEEVANIETSESK